MSWIIGLLLTLLWATTAQAQPWSGIIAPARAMNWANAGVTGGIPAVTTICAGPLSPGANIQTAITNCPGTALNPQVVLLGPGTFSTPGLNMKSGVVLRGAGPMLTTLAFTSAAGCDGRGAQGTAVLCFLGSQNSEFNVQNSTTWTGSNGVLNSYPQGATTISVGSSAGMSATPGSETILILDQVVDTVDTGQVYICVASCSTDNSEVGGRNPGTSTERVQEQIVKVTAINGNTLTITPGLYMPNWRSSQSPGAWWSSTILRRSGVENITLDLRGTFYLAATDFFNAYDCWMKNVRSITQFKQTLGFQEGRNHVNFYHSARITVRDSYFYGTRNQGNLSYGLETFEATDILIENNILQHIVTPFTVGANVGTVMGYNFAIDMFCSGHNGTGCSGVAYRMPGPYWSHDGGSTMELVEGNQGTGSVEDTIHGSHAFMTQFRNQYTGTEPGKTTNLQVVDQEGFARYPHFIGNVLGDPTFHTTTYQNAYPAAANCDRGIFNIGYGSQNCQTGGFPDPKVLTTMMRWANYDTTNATFRFVAGEVPTLEPAFPNPPPTTCLNANPGSCPASFYLPGQPTWWTMVFGSTPPFPAIGPGVNGGQDATGHAFNIPAKRCYLGTATDPAYAVMSPDADGRTIVTPIAFDATACYSTTAPTVPTAPTNFRFN